MNVAFWVWWLAACGPKEPDWVEACDCPDGEICTSGGVSECLAPPAECGDAFSDSCDLSLVDDACTAAICGFELTDSGIAGSTSIEAECWEQDGVTERWFDCAAEFTF